MLIVAVTVREAPVESTTLAVKGILLAAAVGVPVMAPVELFRVRPAGRALIENVYGEIPPVAVMELVYGDPITPFAGWNCSFRVAAILMLAVTLIEAPVESVTVPVTDRLLTTPVGVPVMAPVAAFRLRPDGSALAENVYGEIPPVAVIVLL
jgi:hypothetical protein